MIYEKSRGASDWSRRGVASFGVAVVLCLVSSCSSGATDSRDEPSAGTDADVLAADPRFAGEPLVKDFAADTCDEIAAGLNTTGEFSGSVEARFDAEADVQCELDNLLIGEEQTSASAGLSFYRLTKKELARAADLLRAEKEEIVDCVMYRDTPPAAFGLSTIVLDSGPICDTPPDMGGSTSFAKSGFVANRTLVDVDVSTSRAKNDRDRFTVLDDPVPVRDLIVETTRNVLDSRPAKFGAAKQLPTVEEIQELCTSVLTDAQKEPSSVESKPSVVEIWPSEQSEKNVRCRTSGSEGDDGSEVWTWISITPDAGSSKLEEFYDKVNPEFYDGNEGYVCQLLQNDETHAALSSSSIGETETYSGCESKSDTGTDPASYEERFVFIDDGLVVQAGSIGLVRNDAGEVTESASEVTGMTHDSQKALTEALAVGYASLRT